MNNAKWIPELKPSTSVASAARRTLRLRLEVVRHYLEKATAKDGENPENIHQLRVGARRSGAALTIFQRCLPDKSHRRARKALRQLRRVAGAARDWDVFLTRLNSWASKPPARIKPGLDFLFGIAQAHRLQAEKRLAEMSPPPHFELDRLVADTLAAVHKPHIDPAVKNLGAFAPGILGRFLDELELALAQDLQCYENLHKVRIAGKHLRYAVEVLASIYPPSLRDEHYPIIEQLQEILGDANDCRVAIGNLEEIGNTVSQRFPKPWKRLEPGMDWVKQKYQDQLPVDRDRFGVWHQQWRDAGEAQTLRHLLSL